jgi:hypothetical protein
MHEPSFARLRLRQLQVSKQPGLSQSLSAVSLQRHSQRGDHLTAVDSKCLMWVFLGEIKKEYWSFKFDIPKKKRAYLM